ncbi:MAG: monovalent cation/H+ antiporter complex subunit F [Dehalococcoidia bacterium]
MSDWFLISAAVIILGTSSISIVRVIAGITAFDRILAAGAAGTHAIALLVIIGFLFGRPDMFVDLALTYALLNFIGALAASKYLEHHGETGKPRRVVEDDTHS